MDFEDKGEVQEKDAVDVQEVTDVKSKKALATPAVRRVASEYGINITEIQGSGRDGRVLKEDILSFLNSSTAQDMSRTTADKRQQTADRTVVESKQTAVKSKQTAPVISGHDRTEPVKGMVKAMSKTMTEALKIPHFGYCDEIDVSRLVELRKELKGVAEGRGTKISYMPVILKACSLALSEFPVLNATFDPVKETITYKADHNVGVAMDTPHGLLVPNIKKIQTLSIYEISLELNRLQNLGLQGKLGGADLGSGTFSLSNIGSIGGTYAKPVILPPQVAIGAIGRVQKVPRFDDNDNLVKAHIFNVSWSADHRVIDGATMARFSNLMKSYIENPSSMILDLR
jgi:2-oxoisovalerate dehydrogenase E2 component (dihydrolipoyl transacylase)